MSAPRRGQATALVRRLGGTEGALSLYRALSGDGRRAPTMLFETEGAAGQRPPLQMIVSGAALSATCRGRSVELVALSANGEAALAHVVQSAARTARIESGAPRRATLVFPERTRAVDLRDRLVAPSPLDALRAMGSFEVTDGSTPHGVLCAGVFSYDLIDAFEELPEAARDPLSFPDYVFLLAESLVTIEPDSGRATVVCTAFGSDDEATARALYNDAARRLSDLVRAAGATGRSGRAAPDRPGAELRSACIQREDEDVDMDDDAYAALVGRMKEHIARGDVLQIVPSRTFFEPCPEPIAAYEILRETSPSPYLFFFATGDHTLFGASPETSVRVWRPEGGRGELAMEIRPIAGTRRRGGTAGGVIDPDLDNRREAELLLDEKERAEHVMLVDLARNDVARVCRTGTRRVERLLTVERFSHVMHLVSRVTGALGPEHDALSAYAAAMNMGTLVGAPKVRAAELLREHEATRRGPYGGAIGYFTGDGELDTAVVIRSAVVVDGVAHVRAGAGVVHDSDPLAEAEETRRKAASVVEAVRAARGRAAGARAGEEASGAPCEPGERAERPMEVVLVDNFDSFTWNLVEAFERLGCRVRVVRNTASAREVVLAARATGGLVVLSPGPGSPEEAGSCLEIVSAARGSAPLLGVCLGHQAIVKEAGGVVERAPAVVHGKTTRLEHDGRGPFEGLPSPLLVGRYHSLATVRIPPRLHVHAALGDMAMAVSDLEARQVGLQFHPESILTPASRSCRAQTCSTTSRSERSRRSRRGACRSP